MMKTCAITGHRPARFKFKYDENNNGCKRLKRRLHDQFIILYEQGVRRFYVGGALGVDMWAGEILLHLKEQPNYRKIELVEVLPFEGHDARWDKRSQSRMAFLKENSDFIIVVGEKQNQNSYAERNFYMVEHADCLLAVYDNNRSIRSGTGMTVHYAQQKRLPIILIHPDTAVVTRES